ncbi:LOW QUALITY PROTEIN: hypothetical protein PHMEG_0009610 [Phytophthora megakarya]|uniref:Reverse transcriptase n=1 Tax=Phytophthora megakarya TaxID=4795 RepID=A0A225WFT1_9STRA|nr:LOW QUALITY PROTEIN: hypothetical protein PHMEG_0009610 [Phytophthora megakarya]
MRIQHFYNTARAQALELIREAVDARAHPYLDRVKPGYARKLTHLWHGTFRVPELVSAYALFPIVHVSKLKPVREFSVAARDAIDGVSECFDFDKEFLPEDSWETRETDDDVYEAEHILKACEGRGTCYRRTRRGFHVKR